MKKTTLVLLLVFFSLMNTLKAQISYGGTPTSFGSNFRESALDKVALTPYSLPSLHMEEIRQEDRSKPNNRFAKATFIDVKPENSGLWQTLPTGDRLWRVLLKAQSEEVVGMCLRFDQFKLPAGGKLFVYTADKNVVLGAFTHENNHESGLFATTLIRGKEVVMEYYEPKEVKGEIVLSLNRIDQAYKNPHMEKQQRAGKRMGGKDFGDAGSCTININCSPLANDWQDEKRGVVRIILILPDGASFCSGSLINNTALNNRPLLLTANHCAEGVTPTMLNQWTFDFNYDVAAANCSNPVEPTPQSMVGAQLRASYLNSDFYLVELNQAVPLSYNAYFNGWDRTSTLSPTGTMSIHHPSGDVKKFSLDTGAPVSADVEGNTVANGDFLKVTWNNGITEGGSSGSPLFNNATQGRIVGQLFGGSSFCTPVSAQDDPDWYGKLSVSWTGGGTLNSRLSDWLDPLGTGVTTLNGQNVGNPVVAKFNISTTDITYLPANITFTNTSIGATAYNWNFGTGASPTSATSVGPHNISYTALGTRTAQLTINTNADIMRREISILPSLAAEYAPADGGNFETDNNHFLPKTNSSLSFQRGNSAVVGKNGVASGTNAYVTGLTTATYLPAAEIYLYTPNFNFSAAGAYTLQFKTKFATEANYDGFIVEVSTNRGTSWTQLGNATSANWYNSTVANDVGIGGFPPNTKFFSGTVSTFETKTFDVSSFAGQANVAFRFRFKADDTGELAGVAIDDFQITGPFLATTYLPANNATDVPTNTNLQITFNRPVSKGTGNITIKKVSDNSIVETIAVTSGNVTVATNTATITLANSFATGLQVYVEIANTAFKDANNVNFAGISNNTTWRFTTLSDLVAPTLVSLSPAHNATLVAVDANLVMTMSENVKKGTGNIVIKKTTDNSIVETINVTNANVVIAGAVVTINPATTLTALTDYYVEVANGAIQDMANNNYAGFTGNTTWAFKTDTETIPPTVLSLNPANNSVNVALASNFVMTFSEDVKKGTGNIVIRKASDNTAVETIAITDAAVSIAGAVVTINPANDLVANTSYYVEINAGAIQDIVGNNYAGITGNNTWTFTSLDNILPTLTALSPANNSINILANTNLVMTFSENVKKGASGSISIKRISDNSVIENINITNTIVTASNNTITINPANDLPFITAVYVEVTNGAIQDMAGNNYAGFTGNADWKFTTANETTPPTVVTFSPANNNTSFPGANNLTITFSETVVKGTGNITIKKVSDNSVFETMDINGARVTLAGTLVTINPTNDLIFNTDYYVEITSGGFKDLANNNYAGIANNTTWRFKTDFSTSVEDNQIARAIVIYPNPTDRFATVEVRQGTTLQEVSLRIIDLAGKPVWATQLKQLAEKQAFDWISVPAGSYLLEIKTKQGIAIKPFIKH